MPTGLSSEMQRIGYAPITRIDATSREIEVTATSEAVDAYGTIFDYEASCAAFARWMGNVREMHDALAVGRRVAIVQDPEQRQIRVRLRISRGAESTWHKILDGTLCGASIGAANVTWQEVRRRDLARHGDDAAGDVAETVRVATAYDLVELSLVDNPANPDCVGIAVIRAALPDPAMLDELEAAPIDAGEGERDPAENDTQATSTARALATDGDLAERGMVAATRQAAAGVALLRGQVERLTREHHEAFAQLEARLAKIERQPLPGGPTLRAAEKVLGAPLGNPSVNMAERIAALQAFAAGRPDQHTQVEVAAEILRLQRGEGH